MRSTGMVTSGKAWTVSTSPRWRTDCDRVEVSEVSFCVSEIGPSARPDPGHMSGTRTPADARESLALFDYTSGGTMRSTAMATSGKASMAIVSPRPNVRRVAQLPSPSRDRKTSTVPRETLTIQYSRTATLP